jgi:hypothetical protein
VPLYAAMFEDIDRMDAAAWADWLTDDARFRFGNGDGAKVTVPIVTIYHEREDGKIDDYRVYGDVAPVFA